MNTKAIKRAPHSAPIWAYAKALGKPLIKVAPDDLRIQWGGFAEKHSFNISGTIRTQHEADAMCEIIQQIGRPWLTSWREMVRGDIYPPEPKPTYASELAAVFGEVSPPAQSRAGGVA